MARLQAWAAWFFSCLGIVLLGGSILVVPTNAFADAGGDCASICKELYDPGTTDYYQCLGGCCGYTCSGDGTCESDCCASACGGNGNLCFQGCMYFVTQKNCNTLFCEGGCNLQQPSKCGDRKNDEIWCLKKKDPKQCNGCVCGDYPAYPNTCTCGLP